MSKRVGHLSLFILLLIPGVLQAQDSNILNRVTTAERSDDKGYVVRFQTSQKVDSFKVTQPNNDLIQMTIYGDQISNNEIAFDTTNVVYDEITFFDLPFGVGVDLYIPSDKYYMADAYYDGQSDDLLLALTYSNQENVKFVAEGIDPVIWSRFNISRDSLLMGSSSPGSLSTAATDDSYSKLKSKIQFDVVVIDPGHGGHDPGSIGYRGTKEKDVVLQIAKKLGGYINEYLPDVKVVYTREEDTFVGLEERGQIANKAEGDLFISIHCNSFHNHRVRGTETYFLGRSKSQAAIEVMKKENSVIRYEEGPERSETISEDDLIFYELTNSGYIATSEKLAGMLHHQFEDRAQRHSRGVKQAGFIVLFHASMPALLIESGFISNPSEERYLNTDYGQSIIASAVFRAIRNYKEEYEKSQNFNTN